jgi:aldehyde dehydrogenase (NAD+)
MSATVDRIEVLESGLLIGDRWVRETQGGTMEHIYAPSGVPQKSFAIASAAEVDEAVAAARTALPKWRRWPPDRRRDVLLRLADLIDGNAEQIGTIAALESAKPFTLGVAANVAEWFRYYAGWADKLTGESINPYPFTGIDFTVPEPVGVVGLIVTWNGPIGFCGMGGAPALAAGCCLVIKSPELAPFSTVTFGRLCLEAGIPPGVVNVVTGGPEVGQVLVRHPGVDKICFTGGTATARKLQEACAVTLKPMVMELGGKSANIIFADADLSQAVPLTCRFTNGAGQGCSMPTRLLVERPVYDDLVERVVEHARSVRVGDPFEPGITMGPVISEAAMNRILGVIRLAVEHGSGTLAFGGHRIGGQLSHGYYVEPTVFVDVDNTSELAQEEIFGPVLSITPFDDEDEAIALANGTKYGLAAYAHTQNMPRARRLAAELEAGNVHINGTGPGPLSPATPFGGIKQSGYGRQGSRLGVYEFLEIKNVYFNI